MSILMRNVLSNGEIAFLGLSSIQCNIVMHTPLLLLHCSDLLHTCPQYLQQAHSRLLL